MGATEEGVVGEREGRMEIYRDTCEVMERYTDAGKSTNEERQARITVRLVGVTRAEKNLIEDALETFYDEVDKIIVSEADHTQQ